MVIRRAPAAPLAGRVTTYYGFEEETPEPVRLREGPGTDVVVILTFEEHWLIDGERHTSFVGGLHDQQVTTEHPGRSLGMQVSLDPLAARAFVGAPLHELAHRTVPLEDVLDSPFLVERLAEADWDTRFAILDDLLVPRIAGAQPSREVAWAWQRLRATHGRVPIGELAAELRWSRKRIVARFRDEIGLPPKSVARLLRFERARELAGTMPWGELAFECGFADQPHLIAEFRRITGRTPETFLQDTVAQAA
ncbi:MAG TPA: helix-turn-helix domain-containing protein [Gaiellaceae bacterium]|nr:helix-turn-helix domain-containing protein [Gaiellaceae bacterium]